MTTTSKKQPTDGLGPQVSNQSIQARPLTSTMPEKRRSVGRPAKLEMPALPALAMTDIEQNLFDYFINAYDEQFPDLTPTDHLMLFLAGVEFIKYIRMAREELETGKLVTMSRQHPGVQLRGLLDQLSVTRKARTARNKPDEDEDSKDLRDFFMSLSNGKPPKPR